MPSYPCHSTSSKAAARLVFAALVAAAAFPPAAAATKGLVRKGASREHEHGGATMPQALGNARGGGKPNLQDLLAAIPQETGDPDLNIQMQEFMSAMNHSLAAVDKNSGKTGPPVDADIQELLKSLNTSWAGQWPLEGQEHRPLDDEATGPGHHSTLFALTVGLLVGLTALAKLRLAHQAPEKAREGEALQAVEANVTPFLVHMRALAYAALWRNLHWRALALHVLNIAGPMLMLVMIVRMRRKIDSQLDENKNLSALAGGFGATPAGIGSSASDLALTVSMLCVVLMSMLYFVWHVTAEYESGFRELLHISGLSRTAYMLATAGVEGVFKTFVGLLTILSLAASVLEVRLVVWTSPLLLLGTFSLMASAAVVTGYLIHFCSVSARMAKTVGVMVFVLVLLVAPLSVFNEAIPTQGGTSWIQLALPLCPAFRSLFELALGCMKGRCLTVGDVAVAVEAGKFASPEQMVLGVHGGYGNPSPPEAIVSLWGLVFFQLTVMSLVVLLADMRRHPSLHSQGSQAAVLAEEKAGSRVTVSGLVHHYGLLGSVLPSKSSRVLDGLSFTIAPGSLLGLLGPNGSGKTTTIRCITGEEKPSAGKVVITTNRGAVKHGACVGFCPQDSVVNSDLTVAENLLFFAYLRGARGAPAQSCVQHLLAATRLDDKKDWFPDTLSGGMLRRLAVGCAMIGVPAVTILDEPTTGLDPVSRRGVWSTIDEVKSKGSTCLLTTHLLEEAEALCSHVVILRRGVVAAEGSVQQLKDEWGQGYLVSVESEPGQERAARDFVAALLPESDRVPVRIALDGQMTFKVFSTEAALGHLFIAIADGKVANGIRRWGVSQASLEDAYLRVILDGEDHSQAA